jgi:activating signal cointegrator 1
LKALPLWQPWATLVATGAKRVETRSWPAPRALVGQRIAIHATKTKDHLALCDEEPFSTYLRAPERLPLGAVIATVVLDGCYEITATFARELEARCAHEHAFGDYTPGRFAWDLCDVRPVAPVVPFLGRQGIFDVPDDLLDLPAGTPGQLTVDEVLAEVQAGGAR